MGKPPVCMRGISSSRDRACRNPAARDSVLCESCRAETLATVLANAKPRFRVERMPLISKRKMPD